MKKKVYDIVNAGPRHRFTANGRLVSNCGKMIQPQNYTRPTLEDDIIRSGIELIRNHNFDSVVDICDMVGVEVMELCSSSLRYTITAPKGKKFIVADLSNIEGRVLAYLAIEEWKLEAFRKYDTKLRDAFGNIQYNKKGEPLRAGPDLYIASYAKSFRIPIERVSKPDRQVGKVLELSMGFRGSVGAFKSFAVIYGVDLEELADRVRPTLDPAMLAKARDFYDWLYQQPGIKNAEPCYGLDKETFAALDCLKRLWRESHPAIVQLWDDTENAVRNALAVEKRKFYFGNGMYAIRNKSWVKLVLPSGHAICYPMMEIDSKGKLRYKGVDQFTKKWQWVYTFSGKLVENLVQSFARDIFKHGQLLAESNGYKIVMPVHDELVAEVPDTDDYTVEGLEHYMATVPEWAKGLPLSAEGFSDYRYHK